MNANKLPLVGALIERLRRRSDHEAVKAAMASKGDVTKVEGYKTLADCLNKLAQLDAGTGSLGKPFRTAQRAHGILLKQRPAFTHAFGKGGSEAVQLVYANAVAALWHTVSLLCAEGVTFVKGANGNYGPVANKSGVDGMAGSVIVTRLERFCDAAEKYGFEQTVTEAAPMFEREAFHEAIGLVAGATLAIAGMVALLFVARDLAEKFYSLRGTFTRWLEVQARYLDMNAATVGSATAKAKQEEYASRLRSLADRIRVDDADTERDAVKAIAQDDHALQSDSASRAAAPAADERQAFAATLL